jgi:dihydroorotate dehydrogenase
MLKLGSFSVIRHCLMKNHGHRFRSTLRGSKLNSHESGGTESETEKLLPAKRRLPIGPILAILGSSVTYLYFNFYEVRKSSLYHFVTKYIGMPVLRLYDAEDAHKMAIQLAKQGLAPVDNVIDKDSILKTTVFGSSFLNPIGLAAGFDKDGEAIIPLFQVGFGFVEIGSVTPLPQPGNEKPRMFRLSDDLAVINRYGFNSIGADKVLSNIKETFKIAPNAFSSATLATISSSTRKELESMKDNIFGINIGKNKEGDAMKDYKTGITKLGPFSDYVVINVSSPNTPGLRNLQGKKEMKDLILVCQKENIRVSNEIGRKPPSLLIKIAPDLTDEAIVDIAQVILETKIDGVIVSNTTLARPDSLKSPHAKETGGLSGKPLFEPSTEVLRKVYRATNGKVPIVGVGGVASGKDAYEKIKAGASLVQLYSSLVYEGPGLVSQIKRELIDLLKKDGYSNVSQAVGKDVK